MAEVGLMEKEADEKPKADELAAFSPRMQELYEALSLLYIDSNASGRNKFRDKWPDVALYLFGETLIEYDNDGPADWNHRKKLEDEANQRRVLLKVTIDELIEKSVDSGMLQFEYVGQVIDQFGPDLSQYLYAVDVIERVRPGILANAQKNKDDDAQSKVDAQNKSDQEKRDFSAAHASPGETSLKETPEEKPLSPEEKTLLSNPIEQQTETPEPEFSDIQDELMDVKPIETIAPSQPIAESEQPQAEEKPVPQLSDDALDDVKPIETSAPLSSPEVSSSPVQEKPKEKAEITGPEVEQSVSTEMQPADAAKPDIFAAAEPKSSEPAVVQEAKPEKGVYKALFNQLALPKAA